MKKLFLLVFFANSLLSELVLEITQGTEDPYKVAIIKFSGDENLATYIDKIIRSNLLRTGEFKLFEEEDLLSVVNHENRSEERRVGKECER